MKTKDYKGITLIALIITIIVLLILAGVSIAMVVGDNGILSQAVNATTATDIADVKEQIELGVIGYLDTNGDYTLADVEQAVADAGATLDGTTVTTAKGNTFDISDLVAGAKSANSSSDSTVDTTVDWDAILANLEDDTARAEYLAEAITSGQDSSIEDVAIGTDGSVVNLSLWNYSRTADGNSMRLGEADDCGCSTVGYDNNNIQADGTIIGTVPQYIYLAETDTVYPVTHLTGTFYNCSNLVTAPEIPECVEDMRFCFALCSLLSVAPELPEGVSDLSYAFYYCISLISVPNVPSTVRDMDFTFTECSSLTGSIKVETGFLNTWENCFAGTVEPIYIWGVSEGALASLVGTANNNNVTYGYEEK